jgi:hypothetical protein
MPSATGESPWRAFMRSVACPRGSSALTVTPSRATADAVVFKKPWRPARAVFDRIR